MGLTCGKSRRNVRVTQYQPIIFPRAAFPKQQLRGKRKKRYMLEE